MEDSLMRLFTATVFLTSPKLEWQGEISFPVPDDTKELWNRVFETIYAIKNKAAEFPVGVEVEMGLYLELESLAKVERCRLSFWELMNNCHSPLSIRWRKPPVTTLKETTSNEA